MGPWFGRNVGVDVGLCSSGHDRDSGRFGGRRCANSLGIPVRGTLGLILTAKRRHIIPQARPVLEQLRAAGMYLSDSVMNRALKTVGE